MGVKTQTSTILKISRIIFITLLLLFIFSIFAVDIWDPDFWWHLKTGEYIYQTKALPEKDPFAFTSLPKDPLHPESKRITFILNQYWLAQVIFYLTHHFWSYQGIIFLRASLLTLLTFLIFFGIRREGWGLYPSIVLLIPAVMVFSGFTGERPQLFSFLLSFLLVFFLEGFRKHPVAKWYLFPIPFFMLLWANLHGGFILGIVIVLVYTVSEVMKYLLKRFGHLLPMKSLRLLVVVSILSILSSLINPNGLDVFSVLVEFEQSLYKGIIVEEISPYTVIIAGFYNYEYIAYFFLLLLGTLLFLINIKKVDLTDVALFSCLSIMSLSASRYIPFFTPVALLMIARYGVFTAEKMRTKIFVPSSRSIAEKPLALLRTPSFTILLSTVLSIILIILINNKCPFKSGVEWNRYPVGAVKFLKENRLPGNMLNNYVWGGYMIWALFPDYKVFSDGRGLIEEVVLSEQKIGHASTLPFQGMPEWKALLYAYNINFIVTSSVYEISGRLSQLIPALVNDPEWHLIYMDNISLIFMRDRPENADALQKFGMPKEWVWNEVITEAATKAMSVRNNSNFFITMGDAFLAKKSYQKAKEAYLKARERKPGNPIAQQRLQMLRAYGY